MVVSELRTNYSAELVFVYEYTGNGKTHASSENSQKTTSIIGKG